MIGLGSNRLSVCRRGGMSVTQAGKGGMEWLAGGRWPRWSSPYSAQATAVLLAQFPTQWPTIRDYGFAHPEIVGYMNAYAPEDAKIAYSLVEGIGTRWCNNNGGYAITSINPSNRYICGIIDFKYNIATSGTDTIIGSGVSDGTDNCRLLGAFNSQFRFKIGGDNFYGSSIDTRRHVCKSNMADGTYMDGVKIHSHARVKTPASNNRVLYIFNDNGGGGSVCQNASLVSIEVLDVDNLIGYFIPFKRNGQMELLDLVSGNLATRVGTFTELIESPS